jgi:tetratricopeptide (TPR) repeat protein
MKLHSLATAGILFFSGMTVGFAAQKAAQATAQYHGKDKQAAGQALLELAQLQAGKGSWERIAVGRVYYLGGFKPQGKAIFDDVLARTPEASDLFRIARVYREAGEWEQAKALFERSLRENPDDSKGLAEVGAYYLIEGDRAAAENLFDRSFKIENDELWSTIAAAGGYLNVPPQE